ncbi:c-type heme family protein [Catalinimonas niigatensis]|uniref:c-type heme family protein n=1 Tax=Catalinimonas niigatensis TaxID=1397264 RepID=UPI00266585FB|nr:DUF3365 domain-containing protein [Catalinimonas niigatensis]WPP49291.1 DUF3365 domain-containing protein [Catalinimonas niigatensis]
MKTIIKVSLLLSMVLLLLYSCDQKSHQEQAAPTESEQPEASVDYLTLGQKYAAETQAVLGKNLMASIQREGTEQAVAFCNTRAYPLTDSMAQRLRVHLKRVTDQTRNPDNAASAEELQYIQAGKAALARGESAAPQLQEIKGRMVAYYPILTNSMCMQCHGDPASQIDPATLKKINSLYPNDQATGYTENQLRGIWVVEMDQEEE